MYEIFTSICPKNHPNVGKYTIHGASGYIEYRCIQLYFISCTLVIKHGLLDNPPWLVRRFSQLATCDDTFAGVP